MAVSKFTLGSQKFIRVSDDATAAHLRMLGHEPARRDRGDWIFDGALFVEAESYLRVLGDPDMKTGHVHRISK